MFSPTEAMVPAWVCDLPSIDWDPKADLWKHGQELRKDARNRLRAKATKAIDGYLNRVEALARDRGFEALPAIDEHLKWLVRRQVKGEPERRIAKTTRKARSTIHTALEETAKFLDLPLRDPEPIGRPRRTAD
jgi:hypothetical protein